MCHAAARSATPPPGRSGLDRSVLTMPSSGSPTPHIAVLTASADHETRCRALYGRGCRLICATTTHALLTRLADRAVTAVLLEATDDTLAEVAQCARMIRDAYTSVPIIAVCDLTVGGVRHAVTLARAGADDVLVRNCGDVHRVLDEAVARAGAERLVLEGITALTPYVAPTIRPAVALCLRRARSAVTVESIARELGIHRRTLVSHFAAAHLPSPSTFVSWCRILHAAHLLMDTGRSVEATALMLDFGSGTALRNMLRRYTGLTPSQVRAHGGHRYVLELLLECIMATPSSPCPPPVTAPHQTRLTAASAISADGSRRTSDERD